MMISLMAPAAKIAALGIVVATLVSAKQILTEPGFSSASQAAADALVLVPVAIAGYEIQRRWRHPLNGAVVEDGAVYSPVSGIGSAIQVDYFRNALTPHNGAGCYVGQGERLRSQALMSLAGVAGSSATFMVATMTDGRHLRVAASTQCYAGRCEEQLIPTGWRAAASLAMFDDTRQAVVPMSVVLRQSYESGDDLAAVEAGLMSELKQAVSLIDLAAPMRLAAVMDGR